MLVGGGGVGVGVGPLSEIEIFHPLIIITLAMLVYIRFEKVRIHTMLIV